MKQLFKYIFKIVKGLYHLFQGMYITMLNMLRPKVTEQYPENRGTHEYPERFRGVLDMPHNERNEHRCTACGICASNCPNGTINVISKMQADESGKERRTLDKYLYNLGSCTFCALCTSTCPFGAIGWTNAFEHSVFQRETLEKRLNMHGSKLMTKQ